MKNQVKIIISVIAVVLMSCATNTGDHFIEIQGAKEHVLTLGSGKPLVIFICGGGSDLNDFDYVQKSTARITKTFSYDKPGLGKSELINTPRSLENLAKELRQLLDKEGIGNEPIILVGHSLGGDISRYYIHQYPEHVIGMVLIDPGSEYLSGEIRKTQTEKQRRFEDSLAMIPDPTEPIGAQMEYNYYDRNDSLMRTFEINTPIPITLLESNKVDEEDSMTPDRIKIQMRLYREFQKKVPQMKIISTEKSGHFIQLSEPGLVIDAIKSMLKELK